MTSEEKAIEIIKIAQAEVEWNYPMDYAAAFDAAIGALKKRIPMKIRIEREHPVYGYASFCPNCNRMDVGGWSYCSDCGQAITMR